MSVLDSSFLIDYLDGDETVVAYATDHADETLKATQLGLYEVYLGELYTAGEPDFDAIANALKWVQPVRRKNERYGRRAADFMAHLHESGASLGFRDGYVAASAWTLDERLVTRDADFDSPAVRDVIDVDVV